MILGVPEGEGVAADPDVVPALVELAKADDATLECRDVEHIGERVMCTPIHREQHRSASVDGDDGTVSEPDLAGDPLVELSEARLVSRHEVRRARVEESGD